MFEKVRSVRIALCLIFISFLVFCGFVTARDEKYVTYFIHLYTAGLFRERNFTLHEAKTTFGKDHIHRIEMSFSCYKALPLERARELVTAVAMDFLEKVNNDPGLREKGLIKEKFIPRQLYLRILCDNVVGETYDNIFIREIILDRGQLTYVTFKNMPEFWGKTYTIHEDFDYALMLTGNARHPEDVIAEEEISPNKIGRGMRGDRDDFPHNYDYDDLVYPDREKIVSKESVEPEEAAPSPILPMVVAVETVSQLNLAPVQIPVVEEEVPLPILDMLPPQAPQEVVPTAPAVATGPALLPTAPATEVPAVVPTMNPPTESVVPTLPEQQEVMPQGNDRLRQAEQEGNKLLTKIESPDPFKEDVPTLPEQLQLADQDGAKKDEPIDFFELFDSFSDSFAEEEKATPAAIEETPEPSPTIPGEALPEDDSTPPDENFEMPEDEYVAPVEPTVETQPEEPKSEPSEPDAPQAVEEPVVAEAEEPEVDAIEEDLPAEVAPIEEPKAVEEQLEQAAEEPSQSWWDRLFGSNKDETPAPEDAPIEEMVAVAEEAPAAAEEMDAPKADASTDEQASQEMPAAASPDESKPADAEQETLVVEESEEEPAKSWWERLFGSNKDESPAPEEMAPPAEVEETAVVAQAEEVETAEESNPSWWDRMFDSTKDETPVSEDLPPPAEETSQPEQVEVEETAIVEEQPEDAPTPSWWERLFGSNKDETPASEEMMPPAQIEKTAVAAQAEEVETAEEPTPSWWDRLFGSSDTEEAPAPEDAPVEETVALVDDAPAPAAEELSPEEAQEMAAHLEEASIVEQAAEGAPPTSWLDETPTPEAEEAPPAAEETPITVEALTPEDVPSEEEVQEMAIYLEEAALVEQAAEEAPPASWLDESLASEADETPAVVEEQPAIIEQDEVEVPAPNDVPSEDEIEQMAIHLEEAAVVEQAAEEAPPTSWLDESQAETADEPMVPVEEEAAASWWDRMFSSSQNAEVPPQAEQNMVAEAEEETPPPVEEESIIIEEEEAAAADETAEKGWWDRMFGSSDKQDAPAAASEESPQIEEPPAPDESSEDEFVEQAAIVEEETPTTSWWDRMFSSSDKEEPVAPEETPPAEEATLTVQEQEVEAPAQSSWWQNIFASDKDGDTEKEDDLPPQDEVVAIIDEASSQEEPEQQIQQEIEEEQVDQEEKTESRSWWNSLFSSDKKEAEAAAMPQIEQQETALFVESDSSSDDERASEQVAQTPAAASWWNRLFSTADEEEEEENALQAERNESEIAVEELQQAQLPDTESAQSWWNRILSKQEMPREPTDQPVVNEEAFAQTEALFSADSPVTAAAEEGNDEEEPLIYEDDESTLPSIAVEHSQIDTDEAIGKDEEAHDPVLRSLYREPLSWMQSRASDQPAGTWGDPHEEVIAQEDPTEEGK